VRRYAQFYGFHGLLGGMLVAVKQIMPDHEVKLLGLVQLKTKVGCPALQAPPPLESRRSRRPAASEAL
jgi:hypothetical protein